MNTHPHASVLIRGSACVTSARSVPLVRLIVTQPALMFCIRTGGDRRRDNHRGYKRSYQDSLPGTLPDGHGGHLEDGRARYAWGGRHECCFRKVGGFVYWCARLFQVTFQSYCTRVKIRVSLPSCSRFARSHLVQPD